MAASSPHLGTNAEIQSMPLCCSEHAGSPTSLELNLPSCLVHWGAEFHFLTFPLDRALESANAILSLRAIILPELVADSFGVILALATSRQDLEGHALQISLQRGTVVALLPFHLKLVALITVSHSYLQSIM